MKAEKPGNLPQLIGVGCIAGVGFTMSLFVGALAYTDPALATPVRLGVYAGSIFSAVIGLTILARSLPKELSPDQIKTEDQIRPFIMADAKYKKHDETNP